MKSWEIKLTEKEEEKFRRILLGMIKGNAVPCPHPRGVSAAVPENYCNKMCGVLFPSLEQRRLKIGLEDTCECPCYTISRSHKIKVVRRLLAYNKGR